MSLEQLARFKIDVLTIVIGLRTKVDLSVLCRAIILLRGCQMLVSDCDPDSLFEGNEGEVQFQVHFLVWHLHRLKNP